MLNRLFADSLQIARRGAVRLTGLGVRNLRRVQAALDPRTPVQPQELIPSATLEDLERLLGRVDDVDEEEEPERVTEEILRGRFQALIERSQEVAPPPEDEPHPAFVRIIDALSPDEARIIRLLCEDGPQPVIAVRSSPLIGRGEQTLLDNVSLIGEQAGCHLPERTPAYLDNLCRLGVAERHGEELVGNDDYDVLASRPEVAAAEQEIEEERNQRVAIANGQVCLTRLGELLCDVCLRQPEGTAGL
ncbi:MAG: DUF4393 domain-containing protein [Actinobacteria bacterium]|nr:DUF4393 domain-containing protein [Actinomycetota bacterium]